MADDLSSYGTVTDAPADLSGYGTVVSPKRQPGLLERADAAALNAAGNFASGALSALNPLPAIGAVTERPVTTAVHLLGHPYFALSAAQEALRAGRPEEAAAHIAAGAIPGGFAVEPGLVKLATPGSRAEGLGELAGTAAGAYLPTRLPVIGRVFRGRTEAPSSAPSGAETIMEHPAVKSALRDFVLERIPGVRAVSGLARIAKAVGRATSEEAPQATKGAGPPPLPAQPAPAAPGFDEFARRMGYSDYAEASKDPDVRNFIDASMEGRTRLLRYTPAPGGSPPTLAPPPAWSPKSAVAGEIKEPLLAHDEATLAKYQHMGELADKEGITREKFLAMSPQEKDAFRQRAWEYAKTTGRFAPKNGYKPFDEKSIDWLSRHYLKPGLTPPPQVLP